MGTTANNNWPTPVATDLVKDGWEAIKDLGDAIDTTLGVYAPSTSGLTLINTTTFSGVTSVSLPTSTFTSAYANYQIVVNSNLVSNTTLQFRMRLAGTDNTDNSYVSQLTFASGGSTTVTNTTSTVGSLTGNAGANLTPVIFDVFEPFVAQRTLIISKFANLNMSIGLVSIDHNVATAFDSLSLLTGTGNMTGSVSVYGYKQ
jgi:hypothetical protein